MSVSRRLFLVGLRSEESPPSPTPSLKVLLPGTQAFDEAVATSYPNLKSVAWYSRINQCMAILSNLGNVKAKAYSVEWILKDDSGQQINLRASFEQKHRMRRGSVRTIGPGGLRLLSPFFNFSPEEYINRLQVVSRAVSTESLPESITLVTASLRGVVFADGTVSGADSAAFLRRYRAMRHAEHDEAQWLAQYLQQPTPSSEEELNTILGQHIQRANSFSQSPGAIYWRTRSQEAAVLKSALQRGGLAALQAATDRRISYAREQLRIAPTDA